MTPLLTEAQAVERGLLADILANPPDDAPRLVYADFLDDRGDCDRAEFIRVQCELSPRADYRCPHECKNRIDYECAVCALRRRERDLWAERATGWFDVPGFGLFCGGTSALDNVACVHRGFITKLRAPLAVLLGGPCDRCEGRGRVAPSEFRDGWQWNEGDPCPHCVGGTRPGVGAVVRSQPVERVEVTDKRPYTSSASESRCAWFAEREFPGDGLTDEETIPDAIFDTMVGETITSRDGVLLNSDDQICRFATAAAARAALSAAVISHLRA